MSGWGDRGKLVNHFSEVEYDLLRWCGLPRVHGLIGSG